MISKEESKRLLSDVTWERQMCPITIGSNLLVDLYIKKAFDKKSAVEINASTLEDHSVKDLIKAKRIKIVKKKKTLAYLYRLGRLVAAGEISLRLHEREISSGTI